FAGRHQQAPYPLGGGIFKEKWWQYYTELPKIERMVWAWDTAFKTQTQNDPSCGVCVGVSKNAYYILDCITDRLEYPELKRRVKQAYDKYKTNAMLVEDKASGQSLIQELKRDTRLPVLPVKVETDKLSRAVAFTPTIESGKVYLPEDAPWVADFIAEFASFPNGAHDDRVDALGMALRYLIKGGRSWWQD
ncbi:MAG: phage terminase large subunit, partial [Waterburya sp.]